MRYLLIATLAALAVPAFAQSSAVQDPKPVGADTRAWLELQASNNAAYGASEPVQGEVASRVYERYLKSFEHPIPESFERESFVEGSGGGS